MKILKIASFLSLLGTLPCEAQTARSGMLGYNTTTFTNCGTNCITGTQLNIWNSTLVNSAGFLQDNNTWTGRNVFNNTLQGAINLAPSAPPSTPANGDLWATGTGIFAQIGGVSHNLLGGGGTVASGSLVYTFTTGDNTTALQAAVTLAENNGQSLELVGNGSFTGTISINSSLWIHGQSRDQTFASASTTGIAFAVNADHVIFSDFLINNTSGGTTQEMIKFATSTTLYQWSIVERMSFASPGLAAVDTGGSNGITIRENLFAGVNSITLPTNMIIARATNTYQCNGGENMIYDNYFIGTFGNNQTGISTGCIGGLYIRSNKFVNVDNPIIMYAPTGIASGDLMIQDNSIEQFAGTAIQLNFAGGTGSFENIHIQNNEIKFPLSASIGGVIEILTTGGASWAYDILIEGNTIGGFTSGSNVLINMTTGAGVDISHNSMHNFTSGIGGNITQALNIGTAVSSCTIGPNIVLGVGGAWTPSYIGPTCTPLVAPY
jgi:hypothetical protein